MVSTPLERNGATARIVIIDDAGRAADVERIASDQRGCRIVGIAADVEAGISLIARTKPDLVIASLRLPYIHGKILFERLMHFPPMRKLMIFPPHNNSAMISLFKRLGVDACVDGTQVTTDPITLRRAIAAVLRTRKASVATTAPDLQARRSLVVAGGRPYPVPTDEHARLRAVAALDLANDDEDAQLDRLTAHLARTTDFPICLMNFVGRDTLWIKSAHGFARGQAQRSEAICNYTLATGTTFSVVDTTRDLRFRHYDAVVNEPHVRTYVGHPIVNDRGVRLGALCLLDTKSRSIAPAAVINLRGLCEIAAGIINARQPALAKCA